MNKCVTILFITLIAFSTKSFGQNISKKTISRLQQALVNDAAKDFWETDTTMILGEDGKVSDSSGMWLSHFSAETKDEWIGDIDSDGNTDIIFMLMDAGLGGGGNAYGYDFHVLLLDKRGNEKDHLTFFGGGKLSMATLSVDEIKNGRIYTTYQENPYGNIDADPDNLKTYHPVFLIRDGKLQEEHYNKCPLSAMDKRIFKNCDSCRLSRSTGIDDQFNEEQSESFLLHDQTSFTGILSGCTDADLYFSRTIPYISSLKTDKNLIRNTLVQNIDTLIKITRFETWLKKCKTALLQIPANKIELDKYGGTHIRLALGDNWQANLFTSGNLEQGSFITIRLHQYYKGNMKRDFWAEMDDKMNLK